MRPVLQQQPYSGGGSLRDFLESVAGDESFTHLDVVVAWAKRSGFLQTADAFEVMEARGVMTRMIVGIDAGGATSQGLEWVLEQATESYVFHCPGRTFHPKLYFARGRSRARVLVGSNNLTRGGAIENFELGVALDLDLSLVADMEFASSVERYVGRLLADDAVCLPLNRPLLDVLLSGSQYKIGDEDRVTRGGGVGDGNGSGSLFGSSSEPLSSASRTPGSGQEPVTAPVPNPGLVVRRRWFKKLAFADAQRLSRPTSHPSGTVTLTKAGHPIEWRSYFREVFFGDATWVPGDGGAEQASVEFDVWADGASLGTHSLIVYCNPRQESGQGNRTTALRWGPDLGAYLRTERNSVGDYVTLEQVEATSFRLILSSTPSGPFAY